MIKKLGFTILLANSLFAFDFADITSAVTDVAQKSIKALAEPGQTTNVDKQCKIMFESYEVNYKSAISIATSHTISNSSTISSYLSKDSDFSKDELQQNIKELTKDLAKNSFWIPIEVEKFYGQLAFNERRKSAEIIEETNRNIRYKRLFKKVNSFLNQYKKSNKDMNFPFDLKVAITTEKNVAEALPFGHLIISQNLLESNNYKTILAHELSHISKRHAAKELQYKLIKSYSSIEDIVKFIKNINDEDYVQNADLSNAMLLVRGFFNYYSNEQELEADACGLKTMVKINKNNKRKYANELIQNINKLSVKTTKIDDILGDSHPSKEIRVKNIKELERTL